MYGVPSKATFDPLLGAELLQIRIGASQLVLIFDEDKSISIESKLVHLHPSGDIEIFSEYAGQPFRINSLLGAKIVSLEVSGNSKLTMRFDNYHSLQLIDDSESFESFQFKTRDVFIVV